jgi:hypothetical protein
MSNQTKTILTIVVIVLVSITLYTSQLNKDNYYIKEKDGAVQIWKGRFSPLGRDPFITLPGAHLPDPVKEKYSREEVFPYIAKYYLEKADAVLDTPGLPDFEDMRTYLNKSLSFAISTDMQEEARKRLNKIDRMVLEYKADVAAGKDNIPELKTALEYLNRAGSLGPDDIEAGLIKQKTDSIRARIEDLESEHQTVIPAQEKPVK